MAVIHLDPPSASRRVVPALVAFASGVAGVALVGALFGAGFGGPPEPEPRRRPNLVASAQPRPDRPPEAAPVLPEPAGATRPADATGLLPRLGVPDATALLQGIEADPALATRAARLLASPGWDDGDRHQLVFVLAQAAPEALAAVLQEMSDAPDPAQRRRAFEMLKWTPEVTPELADTARRAAQADADPQVMASAVQALASLGGGDWAPDPGVAGLLPRYHEYTTHPDPAVRAAAAGTLVEAAQAAEVSGAVLRAALLDDVPAVRAAALQAVFNAGLWSPQLRALVLEASLSEAQTDAVQAQAWSLLSSFEWTDAERAQLGLPDLGPY